MKVAWPRFVFQTICYISFLEEESFTLPVNDEQGNQFSHRRSRVIKKTETSLELLEDPSYP